MSSIIPLTVGGNVIPLTPSDVDGLAFQQRGVLINTDTDAYEQFIRRKNALQNKDQTIAELSNKINNLENQMATVLELLQKQTKA